VRPTARLGGSRGCCWLVCPPVGTGRVSGSPRARARERGRRAWCSLLVLRTRSVLECAGGRGCQLTGVLADANAACQPGCSHLICIQRGHRDQSPRVDGLAAARSGTC